MSKYIGRPCVYCKEIIKDGDHVVVCPICGAPHHRHCYDENGRCVFTDKHAEGFEYKPEGELAPPKTVNCPKCGAQNSAEQVHCTACAHNLKGTSEPRADGTGEHNRTKEEVPLRTLYGDIYQNDEFMGVTAKEIAVFVGKGSAYFLMQFKMMKELGRNISINIGAFIFQGLYFLYRKMYKIGFLMLGFFLVINWPQFVYVDELLKFIWVSMFEGAGTYNVQLIADIAQYGNMARMVYWGVTALVSMFANRLYLKHIVSSIKKTRAEFDGNIASKTYLETLARSGRTSFGTVVLVLLSFFAVYFVLVSGKMSTLGLLP